MKELVKTQVNSLVRDCENIKRIFVDGCFRKTRQNILAPTYLFNEMFAETIPQVSVPDGDFGIHQCLNWKRYQTYLFTSNRIDLTTFN